MMGSGFLTSVMPTYILCLGVRGPGHPTRHLHTPTFEVDERAIGVAMRVMGRALLATFDGIDGEEPPHPHDAPAAAHRGAGDDEVARFLTAEEPPPHPGESRRVDESNPWREGD